MTLRLIHKYVSGDGSMVDIRPTCDGNNDECTNRAVGLFEDSETGKSPDLCAMCAGLELKQAS